MVKNIKVLIFFFIVGHEIILICYVIFISYSKIGSNFKANFLERYRKTSYFYVHQ